MPQMMLSVIIPLNNAAGYLEQTLESVQKLALKDMEILCVDDGSVDRTWEILQNEAKTDARIRLFRNEERQGTMEAKKQAVEEAQGTYILFLYGGCILMQDNFQKVLSMAQEQAVDAMEFSMEASSEKVCPAWEALIIGNQIYRKQLVKAAMAVLPEKKAIGIEDVLTPLALQLQMQKGSSVDISCISLAPSMISACSMMPLENDRFIEQGQMLEQLDNLLCSFSTEEPFQKMRLAMRTRCIDAMVWNWLKLLNQQKASQVFHVMMQYLTSEELATCLQTHLEDWHFDEGLVAEHMACAVPFQRHPRCIKTIAAYYYRAFNGGVERVMTSLTTAWVNAGYHVVLITDEEVNELDYSYHEQVTRVSLHRPADCRDSDQERIGELSRVLREHHVDAVVYHAWYAKHILSDIAAIKLLGIAVIIHTHGSFSHGFRNNNPHSKAHFARLNRIYQLADAIVTLSEVDACWWRYWHPHVYRTCNPISINYDAVSPSPVTNHDLLWIGRISPEKQPEMALQIFRQVKLHIPDARMHIVGRGENEQIQEAFEQTIRTLHLEKDVSLHGYQKDVIPYYQKCAVVLCTSEIEGFMLTLAESKVMARPSVIFDLPNLDMVREKQGMWVVPQGDVFGAANAVCKLLTDYRLWKQMSEEARKSAYGLCNFDHIGRWKEIFNDIAADTPDNADRNELLQITNGMLCDDLVEGFERVEADIGRRDTRIQELQDWCTQQDKGKEWLEKRAADYENELERLLNQNLELQSWCTQQDEGKKWLEDKTNAQEAVIERLTQHNSDLQAWCTQQDEGKKWLENKTKAQETVIERLTQQNLDLQAWCTQQDEGKKWLEDKTKVQEAEIERLTQQNSDLQSWCTQQGEGKEWLEDKVKELENELLHRDEQLQQLQAQRQSLEEQLKWDKAKMSSQRLLIERLQTQNDAAAQR